MPFINGRYHMNPTMGHAFEAAREAEAALLALQQHSSRAPQDDGTTDSDGPSAQPDKTPIHHIEIDATELVPTASGRATRGYVARIHRAPATASASAPAAESHAFVDHRDLVNFLRDALARK